MTQAFTRLKPSLALRTILYKGYGMYPALLKAHLNSLVVALYTCTHTHNWTIVDLKVLDQSNTLYILSFTEHPPSTIPAEIQIYHYCSGLAQLMTEYEKSLP